MKANTQRSWHESYSTQPRYGCHRIGAARGSVAGGLAWWLIRQALGTGVMARVTVLTSTHTLEHSNNGVTFIK